MHEFGKRFSACVVENYGLFVASAILREARRRFTKGPSGALIK
jgi:hypothetical protein